MNFDLLRHAAPAGRWVRQGGRYRVASQEDNTPVIRLRNVGVRRAKAGKQLFVCVAFSGSLNRGFLRLKLGVRGFYRFHFIQNKEKLCAFAFGRQTRQGIQESAPPKEESNLPFPVEAQQGTQ